MEQKSLAKIIKNAAIYALIFGAIICSICTTLTGSFLVFFLWIPVGLLFGGAFFLFELLYIRLYKGALQTDDHETHKFYQKKILLNSVVSLGLLFQCGFFAFGIYAIFSNTNFAWSAFVFSAIFALVAYVIYVGATIAEICFFKRKRYLLKVAFVLGVGATGLGAYGYGVAKTVLWLVLSGLVFLLEVITLFRKRREKPTVSENMIY